MVVPSYPLEKESPLPADDLLTINDVCLILKVHHNTVRRWIWAGKLLAYQPGRRYLIPRSALEAFLRSGRTTSSR